MDKELKYLGNKTLFDEQGNEYDLQAVIETGNHVKDYGFCKLWLSAFMKKLDLLTDKRMKFVFWLLDNADTKNCLNYTYRDMAKASGISYKTVADTMKVLLDVDFVRKWKCVYMLNPDVLFKSTNPRTRQGFVVIYQTECDPPSNLPVEDKKDMVSRKISMKQKQYKKMEERNEEFRNEIVNDFKELEELHNSESD